MATFVATTTCNGPRVTDPEAARKVLGRYRWDGEVEAVLEQDGPDGPATLAVYGYDWPRAWRVPDGVDPDGFAPEDGDDPYEGFERFLGEIAGCLAEPLTVQAVGFEQCRFPLAACEWHVKSRSAGLEVTAFRHGREEPTPEGPAPAATPAILARGDAAR